MVLCRAILLPGCRAAFFVFGRRWAVVIPPAFPRSSRSTSSHSGIRRRSIAPIRPPKISLRGPAGSVSAANAPVAAGREIKKPRSAGGRKRPGRSAAARYRWRRWRGQRACPAPSGPVCSARSSSAVSTACGFNNNRRPARKWGSRPASTSDRSQVAGTPNRAAARLSDRNDSETCFASLISA